jgi:hypothetical protein
MTTKTKYIIKHRFANRFAGEHGVVSSLGKAKLFSTHRRAREVCINLNYRFILPTAAECKKAPRRVKSVLVTNG